MYTPGDCSRSCHKAHTRTQSAPSAGAASALETVCLSVSFTPVSAAPAGAAVTREGGGEGDQEGEEAGAHVTRLIDRDGRHLDAGARRRPCLSAGGGPS